MSKVSFDAYCGIEIENVESVGVGDCFAGFVGNEDGGGVFVIWSLDVESEEVGNDFFLANDFALDRKEGGGG